MSKNKDNDADIEFDLSKVLKKNKKKSIFKRHKLKTEKI